MIHHLRPLCIIFLALVASTSTRAGEYYNSSGIDTYDPVSGIYYKSITTETKKEGLLSSSSRQRVTNINIFDPTDGSSRVLFSQLITGRITAVCFESGFKDGAIQFNDDFRNCTAKNNQSLTKRELKDKLLTGVELPDGKGTELFVSDKRGKNLRRIASVPADASWHIDVRNSKLRIVNQVGPHLKIQNHDW